MTKTIGLVTIGQSPRSDVVPDMAAILGPGVEIGEAGALEVSHAPRSRHRLRPATTRSS
jgi:hypothetical protein